MSKTEELDLEKLLAEFNENDGDHDDLECVEEGDWVSEYKDEYRTDVYRHTPTGLFVAIHIDRRGSYWTDYEYGEYEINEVVAVTKTVTVYEAVQ